MKLFSVCSEETNLFFPIARHRITCAVPCPFVAGVNEEKRAGGAKVFTIDCSYLAFCQSAPSPFTPSDLIGRVVVV